MTVLILHNRYLQAGGEDAVVDAEIRLLRSQGIKVYDCQVTNETERDGIRGKVQLGFSSTWSDFSYNLVKQLCAVIRPDIAHVHNFWMRLSPSVHLACQEAGVATVQTLHNFRLLCPRADFSRNGQVCQQCLGHGPWPGIIHRCYRDSLVASSLVARMIVVNRTYHTWEQYVNAFIALSEHSRSKFVAGGIPENKIFVKPNFLSDIAESQAPPSSPKSILFAGRLAREKGVDVLLRAWSRLRGRKLGRLLIMGDGPARAELERAARLLELDSDEVRFLGARLHQEVIDEMVKSTAVVLPSLCFENCPSTLLEAFCCGRPVIVSSLGALNEIVRDGEFGLKFEAGNEQALANALETMLTNSGLAYYLGCNARREYFARYTPSKNFQVLSQIYKFALRSKAEATAATPALEEMLQDMPVLDVAASDAGG